MLILMTALSALAVLALFVVLAYYVFQIVQRVDGIGGAGDSFLAKIRLGLRAIEVETGHLPGNVADLNQQLGRVADGLGVIDRHLEATALAASEQDKYR